ncbi:MAG: divalent-cation tolerance protein CutA [Planctomycetota bacterium]|nr:MAG: divalent-cation tolerance protein CutA [Planctomycetota bacterium]
MPLAMIVTTVESPDQAEDLGRDLVEQRLAACVQVTGPIRSFYRWKGQVCDSAEWRLAIKTTVAAVPRVVAHLQERHPYEVPEILIETLEVGAPAYLQWASEQVD